VRCPACNHPDTKVLDSREGRDGELIRRRRECHACMHRFTTHERVEQSLPSVLKRNGERQAFDRAKLRRGLELACRKRPVAPETLERLVAEVEQWAMTRGDRELPAAEIGEHVRHKLYKVDQVAYVRFVSVYRSFHTVEEFEHLLREMEKGEKVDDAGQRKLFEDEQGRPLRTDAAPQAAGRGPRRAAARRARSDA